MELSEEEKEAKLELNRFIYGKQLSKDDIVDYLGILFNLIEKQQKEIEKLKEEIDTWEETENDYEHELARKDEEIEEMLEELEIQKRLIIEQIKRFCELYKPKEGIGEGGLDELAEKILSFSKDYISKGKIREKIKELEKEIEEKREHGVDFTLISEYEIDTYAIIQVLQELLEEK